MGERLDVPIPKSCNRICIVLVKPQFDGNIGAVARSMLNFGISDLRIVGRENYWSEETRNRAIHAQSVLDKSNSFDKSKYAFDANKIHELHVVTLTSMFLAGLETPSSF